MTGLIPDGTIARGAGKAATVTPAQKGEAVAWNDDVTTSDHGRMRIGLEDQSVLSLGAKSELRIIKHDAYSQQTEVELTYGRLRAEVSAITRQDGKFEVRTPVAVMGVLGTEFVVDVDEKGETSVTCIKGKVKVRNSDGHAKGEEVLTPGRSTRVRRSARPEPAHETRAEELESMRHDTDLDRLEAEAREKPEAAKQKEAKKEEKDKGAAGQPADPAAPGETTGKSEVKDKDAKETKSSTSKTAKRRTSRPHHR